MYRSTNHGMLWFFTMKSTMVYYALITLFVMVIMDNFNIYFLECRSISMGQGQDVHGRRLMNQCLNGGGWVLLQNCHLGLDYIEEVMDQVVETETIEPSFRLWVTTEIHPKFPITFLQVSNLKHKAIFLSCND